MKSKKVILAVIIGLFSFLCVSCLILFAFYKENLKPVGIDDSEVTFVISSGMTTSTIIDKLKSENIIRNELVFKIYAKTTGGTPKAGTYVFTKDMDVETIWDMIVKGLVKKDTVWITFVEGKRLTYIKKQISDKFPYTEEEIDEVLEDKTYIKELINKYDILTSEILNEKIYHPLEGYLFPDTYEFEKDASIKTIIETMIKTMESKLSSYKDEIESSKYSIHELITLASIVELEGARSNERNGIAGVFYNRLKAGWTLGSDVTTFYAVNKDFDKSLTRSDLNSCNDYNTRGTCVKGLPVGPIASVSIASIDAVMKPESHNYYYFVADNQNTTYFTKTQQEHDKIIRKLQSEGLWYSY